MPSGCTSFGCVLCHAQSAPDYSVLVDGLGADLCVRCYVRELGHGRLDARVRAARREGIAWRVAGTAIGLAYCAAMGACVLLLAPFTRRWPWRGDEECEPEACPQCWAVDGERCAGWCPEARARGEGAS